MTAPLGDPTKRDPERIRCAVEVSKRYAEVGAQIHRIFVNYVVAVRAERAKRRIDILDCLTADIVRATQRTGLVYYVERAGLVKIGFTSDIEQRLVTLRSSAIHSGLSNAGVVLLGLEPGTTATESRRHRQFSEHRRVGEWFQPSPELLRHISSLWTPTEDVRDAVIVWNAVKQWFHAIENVAALEAVTPELGGLAAKLFTARHSNQVVSLAGAFTPAISVYEIDPDYDGPEPRDIFEEVVDAIEDDRAVWCRLMERGLEAICASVRLKEPLPAGGPRPLAH